MASSRLSDRFLVILHTKAIKLFGLAGGIDTFKNAFKSVEITDKDGNVLNKDDIIPPEATITVKSNNAFYKWNQVAGGITAILTAISTVLSIYMVSRSM